MLSAFRSLLQRTCPALYARVGSSRASQIGLYFWLLAVAGRLAICGPPVLVPVWCVRYPWQACQLKPNRLRRPATRREIAFASNERLLRNRNGLSIGCFVRAASARLES